MIASLGTHCCRRLTGAIVLLKIDSHAMQRNPGVRLVMVGRVSLTVGSIRRERHHKMERVKEAAKRRATLEIRDMQKRARTLAEHEYVTGPALEVAANPPVTPVERKRTMRNKSAFISRQTQRHYQRFLSEYITRTEAERDAALKLKNKTEGEVATLRDYEKQLQERLARTSRSGATGNTSTSVGTSQYHASRQRTERNTVGSSGFDAFTGIPAYQSQQPRSRSGTTTAPSITTSTSFQTAQSKPVPTNFTDPTSLETAPTMTSFPMSSGGYGDTFRSTPTSVGFESLFDPTTSTQFPSTTAQHSTVPSIFATTTRAASTTPSATVLKAAAALTGWGGNTGSAPLVTSGPLPAPTSTPFVSVSLPTTESSVQEILDDALGGWSAPLPAQPRPSPSTQQDSYP